MDFGFIPNQWKTVGFEIWFNEPNPTPDPANPPAPKPADPPTPKPADPPAEKTSFTKDEVSQQIKDAVKAALEQDKQDREKAAKEQTDKDQGNFKALYEAEQGKVAALESEKKTREDNDTRVAACKAAGIPESFAPRLQGSDKEAYEKDAKELKKQIGTKKAPDAEGGSGNPTTRVPENSKDQASRNPRYSM